MQNDKCWLSAPMEKHRSYIIVTLRLHARVHLYYNLAASLFHGIKTQMQLWKGLIAPYFLKCARRLNIMYWAICIDDSAPRPSAPISSRRPLMG